MYFEIDNTPEPVKKKRIVENQIEEVPTLILTPFTRAPQVIFENVPIGVRVERYMNVVNPTQKSMQIFLGKALPQELKINLVEGSLSLDPQDCVCVNLSWTPLKPTAHRETIHFTDQDRGRYDVVIVLKSIVVKKLISKKKLLRKSPTKLSTKKIGLRSPNMKHRGSISKGVRKSPDNLERRSSKYHVTSIPIAHRQQLQNVFIDFHPAKHDPLTLKKIELRDSSYNNELPDSFYSSTSDKENQSPLNLVNYVDKSKLVPKRKCLTSPNSVLCKIDNLNFTPFKGFHPQQAGEKHNYTELDDISLFSNNFNDTERDNLRVESTNVVKGQETNQKATDIFDNFNFTPSKNDLRNYEFEIDTPSDIRRETYAIKQFPAKDFITKSKNPIHYVNKSYPVIDLCNSVDTSIEYIPTKHVTEILSNGKSALTVDVTIHKENTTINIDTKEFDDCFLRKPEVPGINVTFNNLERTNLNDTNMTFKPHVCSTERKSCEMGHKGNPPSHICKGLFDNETCHQGAYGICNGTVKLSSGTCNKGDSPIVPLDPKNPNNLQSSPYSTDPQCVESMQGVTLRGQNKCQPKSLMFIEEAASKSRRIFKDRNCGDGVRSIIEADMWQKEVRNSPLRSLTPPLMSIPEESTQHFDSHIYGKEDTYTVNHTYDHCKVKSHHNDNFSLNQSRMTTTTDANLWKVPNASVRTIRNKQQPESSYHAVNPVSLIGNVYTSSSTIDPFLSATYFYDEQSVDRFEQEFKRWLNYLLTPPAEFETDGAKIDVGKVWIETKNKEIPAAPTREQVSSQYHNSHRLDSLRKAARNLIMTPQMSQVFIKLGAQIDKQIISIRKDKCLHLDIGLQKLILDILFCYNPLWLRIGLEALYGTVIPLSSNSDMYGLSVFIIQNMFKDPYMFSKHQNHKTTNMLREAYTEQMKKFTLKKYFMLVYFLDQAKQKKLICHDPCLFRRNAPSKESRDMLIRFTRELIAGVGDITKHLRPLGYVVTHKQSYLDEFKYAVHNLAIDLKDGIRLTKVMEIILVKDNLTKNLRTPPISLLQKIHNCKVALQALHDAKFNIVGDITPRDIVDGHREKTLSLLWQIIHVFRAPLFIKAAVTIQAWWRNKYLSIIVRKRIEHKKLMVKHNAASVLQIWWQRILYNRIVEAKMRESTAASIVVQKYFRMWRQRTTYMKYRSAALVIQIWYRNIKAIQQAKSILEMLVKKHRMASKIQNWYRKQITARKLLCIRDQYILHCVDMRMRSNASNLIKQTFKSIMLRKRFRYIVTCVIEREKVRKCIYTQNMMAVRIQSYFRCYLERKAYMKLQCACIKLQSHFRRIIQRRIFLKLKYSTQVIETRYLAVLHMRKCKSNYENLYRAILFIQRQYRARNAMVSTRNTYLQLKQVTELIQGKYRAKLAMRCDRKSFLITKTACITIQSYFRMYIERRSYMNLKYASIKVQSHYKAVIQRQIYLKLKYAAITIGTRYKSILNMRKCRSDYEKLYKTILFLQRLYKAKIEMISTRTRYLQLKHNTEFVQQKYRAKRAMRHERDRFLQLKLACIIVQRRYRANRLRNRHVSQYQELRNASVIIQNRFRANRLMTLARNSFTLKKKGAVAIQRYYRAHSKKKIEQRTYVHIRNCVVRIQTVLRSYLLTKEIRMKYTILRHSVITVQRRYRAIKEMQYYRHQYVSLKTASIVIQKTYRGRKERDNYLKLQHSIITIQRRYRANLLMKAARSEYLNMKNAATCIQTWFRATLQMKTEQQLYRRKLEALRLLQVKVRATLFMKSQRRNYQQLRHAAIIIQRRYRSIRLARQTHQELVRRVVTIQSWYRSITLMRLHTQQFFKLKMATIAIQKHYRSTLAMRRAKSSFVNKRMAAIKIQRFYRSICLMRLCKNEYTKKRTAALVIQSSYRMHKQRMRFLRLKIAVICLQKYIRSYSIMKKFREGFQYTILCIVKMQSVVRMSVHRKRYLRMREAVLILQIAYRQRRKVELARLERKKIISSAICIQKNFRTYLAMKRYRTLRSCVVTLQQRWRSTSITRTIREEYTYKRNIIISIQARVRGVVSRHEFAKKRRQLAHHYEERKKNIAVLKIQSVWRGYRVRKQMEDWTRLVKLRKRWQEGALQSTQETLSERNQDALQVLCHFRDVASVIRAFISLDLLTSVCPMLYLTDNKAKSVCTRIIMYIELTNRSISTLETLRLGSSIIVNMARYKPTALLVYEDGQVLYILKSMLKWCDKDSLLFCSLCTYLWLFGKYESIAQDLKKMLKSGENYKMLCKIRGLVQRRKRMQENSVRHKANLSSSYCNMSFNMSMNQSHLLRDNSPPTPQLEPDFGLAREGGVRFFQNEMHAIDSVFMKFNIPIN